MQECVNFDIVMIAMIALLGMSLLVHSSVADIIINADAAISRHVKPFWKSTGFCPPDPKENIPQYLLSDEQKINIALLGSLPNRGIEQIRIHWLLNLLTRVWSKNNGLSSYNFTNMDKFLEYLRKYNLAPGFELMGSSNKHISFEKHGKFWQDLSEAIAKRYIGRFGAEEVSRWRFETWNEPDLKSYNVLNFTTAEYLQYVTSCSEGLKKAFFGTNRRWRLGGPAGLFRDKGHPLCWGLLDACNRLRTPGTDLCPVQFISFHRKGEGHAEGVLNGTFRLLDFIHNKFPELRAMAIANDEADIEKNWSASLDYRADARYPSMITKVISGYYKSVRAERKLKIEVLSNDNAFLNYHPFYFTQRTLFARFQINTTSPPHSQFIKKPAYSLMALLSFLGDQYLEEERLEADPLLTIIASRSEHGKQTSFSAVLAYGNDTNVDTDTVKVVNVVFKGMDRCKGKFVVYRLDNVVSNPFVVWQNMGKPASPNLHQRRKMRDVEEPLRLYAPSDIDNHLNISLKFTLPSIHLINICCKIDRHPKKIVSLNVLNITNNEVLITWKYKHAFGKCIRTYEVEFQSNCSTRRTFQKINPIDMIFLSFHFVGKASRTVVNLSNHQLTE